MKYYLLLYDRRFGRLLQEPRQYSAAQKGRALADRFALERKHAKRSDVEVVLLGADSLETLRRTHGRYFKTFREIAAAS